MPAAPPAQSQQASFAGHTDSLLGCPPWQGREGLTEGNSPTLCASVQGNKDAPLPSKDTLEQMAAFTKQPALSMTGSVLAAMSAAAGSTGSSAAIMLLPGHVDTEYSALAKSCCCCNKPEEKEVSLGCCCRRLSVSAPSIFQLPWITASLVVLLL